MKPLDSAKLAARQAALICRAVLDPLVAGEALAINVLNCYPPPLGAVVAGYWPMGTEIDIRPLLIALHARGHRLCLPITPRRHEPLTFGSWRPDDTLLPERFGTMRPVGDILTPDVLLIPLLAFDTKGGRLGYGGGFYDRTLAALPGRRTLGCAFDAQQVDAVPIGPYDIRLDAVATESGVIRCGD
jgi:5-formyltetrahydrofolate cyclo-ligase